MPIARVLTALVFFAFPAASACEIAAQSAQSQPLSISNAINSSVMPLDQETLVLIHGLGASASVWKDVAPYLSRPFQVFFYELAGHGRTNPLKNSAQPSLLDMTASFARWLTAQGLENVHLVGHGIGGLIAMNLALEQPQRVRSLTVIDSWPRPLHTCEQKASIARALLQDYDRFVASHFIGISEFEHVNEQAVDLALRTDSASLAAILLSSLSWDLSERIARLCVPMLVIGSAFFLPQEKAEHELLEFYGYPDTPMMKTKRIPGSGHYLMLENPDLLAKTILTWLQNQD